MAIGIHFDSDEEFYRPKPEVPTIQLTKTEVFVIKEMPEDCIHSCNYYEEVMGKPADYKKVYEKLLEKFKI